MRLFLTTSLAFITALGLSSCLSSDDQTQPITIYVNVENPSGLSGLTGGQTVSLISSTGYNYMAKSDADGTATFTNVIPDIYNVSVSWSITSDQYMEATGETNCMGTCGTRAIKRERTAKIPIATRREIGASATVGR